MRLNETIYSHRKFNESCLINDLLPTYTNICVSIYISVSIARKLMRKIPFINVSHFLRESCISSKMYYANKINYLIIFIYY